MDDGAHMTKKAAGTYVYCLVASPRQPSLARVPRGLAGMGRARLLAVGRGRWLVVADAPLDTYGEGAINRGLGDLDWVSRAAVAHEAVVEAFTSAPAVVPMKLFTIFRSDDRALEHVAAERARIDAVLKRVTNHLEWGVRVMLDPASRQPRIGEAGRGQRRPARPSADESGAGFLARKKSQRDAAVERAGRARGVVEDVYERLAAQSRLARRRTAAELPVQGGPLLLDAAFLVPKSRSGRFEKLGARAIRDLGRQGYRVTVTGPWPAYSFIQE
jgi:hypothetical protein